MNNQIISSWKDSLVSGNIDSNISDFINVPKFGCFKDKRESSYDNLQRCLERIWKMVNKVI